MIHLTEGMILSIRDREPVADEMLAHVEACATCARALADARARAKAVEQALSVLAFPGRVVDEGLDGAAGGGRPDVVAGTGSRVAPDGDGHRNAIRGTRGRGAAWTIRWLGRAAVLALIGAGALSALPGPFSGWIPRMFPGAPPPSTRSALPPSAPDEVGGRMAVTSGPVTVRLENAPPGTVIDVRRGAEGSVGVLAGTGSEFSYGGGEVRASIGAGPVTVELPEEVVPATLVVNGRIYLVMDAAGMEAPGPGATIGEAGLATFRVPD